MAQYRVTSKDVLYGRSFDDCIEKGSCHVDIHEGTGITFRYLNGDESQRGLIHSEEFCYNTRRESDCNSPKGFEKEQ